MKTVVVYSGGMDSYTLLHKCLFEGDEVFPISFNYGQRHSIELEKAGAVCKFLELNHRIVDLRALSPVLQGSALTSAIDVPEGHYAADNMRKTVVPNRNMIMLSIAAGYAVSIGAKQIATAVHAGDHDIYPDCRPPFIDKIGEVLAIANYEPVAVYAPYLDMDKEGILLDAKSMGLEASNYFNTWTCYNGRGHACGKCGSCVERLEAFQKVGWDDPLPYEDKEFFKQALAQGR